MEATTAVWLNLLVRWAHVITGIAWIGSSFFFMWLDSHLVPSSPPKRGVEGELWMVHSGGFYQVEKIRVAPSEMPQTLHWFKWEAAFTWLTGVVLLGVVYYLNADVMLIGSASGLGAGSGIGIGIGSLIVAWVVYDAIWSRADGPSERVAAVASFGLLMVAAYGYSRIFDGRAAYIHVGALLGTLMAVNVWVRIIPAQRGLVTATKEGTSPDPTLGRKAKQRSIHNNYMTLPVVFVMVSNHFPMTYGHAANWMILGVLFLVGAGVRHYFNLRHRGRANGWLIPAAAVVTIVLAVVTAPRPAPGDSSVETTEDRVPFASVRVVIAERCATCHSASPTDPVYPVAPNGVAFDTPAQIRERAALIHDRVVVTRTMPLGNLTGMTEDERALLGRWIVQGAVLR